DGEALVRGTALARRHTADDLRAVLLAARGVERAFLAGDPLHDHARGSVHENRHYRSREIGVSRGWPVRDERGGIYRSREIGVNRGWPVPDARGSIIGAARSA